MAKKSIIAAAYDVEATTLVFTVEGAGQFNISIPALSEDIRHRAMLHGLVQKVSDAAAIAKADLPDDPAEIATTKFEAMQAVADRLIAGDWKKPASGDGAPVAGIIYRAFAEYVETMAIARKKPVPTATAIKALYDSKSRSDQLALRKVDAIAAIIERMKAEKGADKSTAIDTDALLSDLGL